MFKYNIRISPEEFGGSNVHSDVDFASVTSFLDGSRDQIQSWNNSSIFIKYIVEY